MADPMDKNTGQAILNKLKRLIELMEEQNKIMNDDEFLRGCCSGCDGDCGKED